MYYFDMFVIKSTE